MDDQNKLRLSLFDILNGYSKGIYNNKDIYIKHHTNLDFGEIDSKKEDFKIKAELQGLPSLAHQNEYIIDQGFWSKDKDLEIDKIKLYVSSLKQTKSKFFKEIDIKNIQKMIDDENKKLSSLEKEKKELIGLTSEDFATKKINEYYIYTSFFEDNELKKRFFSHQEFNELENKDLKDLIFIYNNIISNFAPKNLKKIALSSSFLTLFNTSNDDAYSLYGKPIINLTVYQIEIFGYARYFKSIISDAKHKPPEDYYQDPDKLIEWIESSKNIEETLNKSNNLKNKDGTVATTVVGASKKDLEKIGSKDQDGIDLYKEALKKGGSLNMEDLIKMHKS